MDLLLHHEYTLNPDGSGKAAIRWEGPMQGPEADPGPFIGAEVRQGKGIDAWESASCAEEDGRLVFKAVVYFRELGKLRFHCQGLHCNFFDLRASQDAKGNLEVVSLAEPKREAPAGPVLSDAELRAKLAEERGKFEMMKGFISEFIGGLRCSAVLHLPGKVGAVTNGMKQGERAVRAAFDGGEILKVFERMMTDDELAMKVFRGGTDDPQAVLASLGEQGPLRAATQGKLQPAFDYDAGVAAARETFAELLARLEVPREPDLGPPLANGRILGVKIVREADDARGLNPLGQNYASLSLAFSGDLPGPAISADEGSLDAALLDTGEDLAPDDEWKRRISFPKLTGDRQSVFFDLELPLPPEGAAGFREIRGTIRCKFSSGSDDVDLGLSSLEAGSEGAQFGARIEQFAPGEDRHALEIRLELPGEQVEGMALLDGAGEAIPLRRTGYSFMGDSSSFSCEFEGALPSRPRLVARIAKGLEARVVPFRIENVDLLGRPRLTSP